MQASGKSQKAIFGVRFLGFQMAKGRYVLPKNIVARLRENYQPEKAPLLIETSDQSNQSGPTAIKTLAKEEPRGAWRYHWRGGYAYALKRDAMFCW